MSDLKKTLRKLVNKTTVCSNTSEGEKTVYMDSIDDFEQIVESLLSKQRASLIKEFEGVIGDDENVSEAAIKSVNDGGESIIMTNVVETVNRGIRNELRAEQRTKLQAIKRNL